MRRAQLKRDISNCFRHSGFGNTEAATGSTEAEDELLIDSRWMTLEEMGFVTADVQLDDFVNVDANVEVYEELTDSQIIESAQKHDYNVSLSDEDDDLQDTMTPSTALKVMDSFDFIRKVIGTLDDDTAMALLTDCETRVMPLLAARHKQSKLTDFWK